MAIITEACIGVKNRRLCRCLPVQCIDEFDAARDIRFAEDEAGSGESANTHTPSPEAIGFLGDTLLYVNVDECTSCTASQTSDGRKPS